MERNVVLTLWDWSRPTAYLHDLIGTDRRKPTLYPNGKLYGSPEESTDYVPILDPGTHTATEVKHPVRDPKTPSSKDNPMTPSPYWGDERIWDSQTSNHNPMMDEKGRVWFTTRVRPPANPDFCKKGSEHPSAKVFPLENANRHLSMYDPATGKFTLISTCFPTHHLIFAEDANTLWTSARPRQWRCWLAEPEAIRGDWRRGEVARLDPAHPRHQWQRQAGRVCRAGSTGRPDEDAGHGGLLQRGRAPSRRVRLGDVAENARLRRAPQPRTQSIGDGAGGNLRATVAGLGRAAVTSIATACSGRHWRADISRALIGGVQGLAQRAKRDRQALPRRLDAPSATRTAVQGRAGRRQRRVELLHLGRLV